ncbi:MAG: FAD-dependent oxidoreductase [Candidatus Moranbacteria bacterium]|nr:FAD-dependent oxidoreductase [Candidatus Moranbacteria bacterium]
MYDIIIIGGGPAAVAVGVYAARKKMKTAFVADQIGGQSIVSDGIENWIGEINIAGPILAKKLKDHIENYKDEIEMRFPARADKIEKNEDGTFSVFIGEEKLKTKTIVVCTGGRHRKLGVLGEEKFNGRGVVYCATCDAPFFKEKDVVVVGGGNSGLEAVVDLLKYADKIYLIARNGKLRGDSVTQEEIIDNEKVEIIYHSEVQEVLGDKMVEGVKIKNLDGDEKLIDVQGVFVEIGSVPNSEIVGELVDLDEWGNIKIDFKNQATSCEGVFAAGDVTDTIFRQNNIAVGDGIKALLSAYDFMKKN